MATVAAQDKQLDELLRCSVCINVFNDPRTLPCLHTFCFKCIGGWCKDKKPGDKLACPECREEFSIPDSGFDGLKKNFFIESLLGVRTGSSHQLHQSVLDLQELKSGVGKQNKNWPIFCSKHTDEQLEFFCLDDRVPICPMCFCLDHQSHQCEEIKKVAEKIREEKREQHLETVIVELEQISSWLNSANKCFFDQVKNAEANICEEADTRIQMIKTHQCKLISELQYIILLKRKIDRGIQEFTQKSTVLTKYLNLCDELLKEGSDVNICRGEAFLNIITTELLVHMQHTGMFLKTMCISDVIFSPSSVMFEDSKSILGQLRIISELEGSEVDQVTFTQPRSGCTFSIGGPTPATTTAESAISFGSASAPITSGSIVSFGGPTATTTSGLLPRQHRGAHSPSVSVHLPQLQQIEQRLAEASITDIQHFPDRRAFQTPSSVFQMAGQTSGFNAATTMTSASGGSFECSGAVSCMMGTAVVKFVPVNGSDVVMKYGNQVTVKTKLQCITGMKVYENKSLEELRFNDYIANRKGPQHQRGAFNSK